MFVTPLLLLITIQEKHITLTPLWEAFYQFSQVSFLYVLFGSFETYFLFTFIYLNEVN